MRQNPPKETASGCSGAAEKGPLSDAAESVRAAERNAALNNLRVCWVEQDVFQFLRGAQKAEEQFDFVILDPPSFTKTKGGLHDALRGYRELHLRAFFRLTDCSPRFPARITSAGKFLKG